MNLVRELVRHGTSIMSSTPYGITTHHVSAANHAGIMDAVVEAEADVVVRDLVRRRSLHRAACNQNGGIIRMLMPGTDSGGCCRLTHAVLCSRKLPMLCSDGVPIRPVLAIIRACLLSIPSKATLRKILVKRVRIWGACALI